MKNGKWFIILGFCIVGFIGVLIGYNLKENSIQEKAEYIKKEEVITEDKGVEKISRDSQEGDKEKIEKDVIEEKEKESVNETEEEEKNEEDLYFSKNIKGRGNSDEGRSEPQYVGLNGYVVVSNVDDEKKLIKEKEWKVPVYKKIDYKQVRGQVLSQSDLGQGTTGN